MTTNLFNEIGGYFELETDSKKEFYPDAIALNSARSCLRYVIRAYQIKEIWIPFYTCNVIWQAARNENCKVKFYHIDENFLPTVEFEKNDFILYTNYFGICAKNVENLSKKYTNLIVDNAQAFYMPKSGLASFYSPRKFFGVPDGGYLFCEKKLSENLNKNESYQRCSHLLKRIDLSASEGYSDFQLNDASLENEPIELMSNLTKKLLSSLDYEKIKTKRLENFDILNRALEQSNELKFRLETNDVPMVYPYLVQKESLREKLIKNKIYVATYWSPLDKEFYEAKLQKYLLPLPIDQRYGNTEMEKILEVINA